jgi:hypothetical protein
VTAAQTLPLCRPRRAAYKEQGAGFFGAAVLLELSRYEAAAMSRSTRFDEPFLVRTVHGNECWRIAPPLSSPK